MSSPSSSSQSTISPPHTLLVNPVSSNESGINPSKLSHKAWYCRHEILPQFLAKHANATSSTGKEIQKFLGAGKLDQILRNNQEMLYDGSKIDFVVQVDATTTANERGHTTERRCLFASVGEGEFYEISRQIWREFHAESVLLDECKFVCVEHEVLVRIRVFVETV